MKNEKIKFVKKSSLFLFFLLIAIIGINYLYTTKINSKKLIKRKRVDFQKYIKKHKNIDYLFLGDSHTQKSINPDYIKNSYNLGYSGENYIETYLKLKKAINKKIDIKNIVLEIDLHSLYRKNNIRDISYYKDVLSLKQIIEMHNLNLFFWHNIIFSFIGQGNDIIIFFKKNIERKINKGYIAVYNNFTKQNMTKIAHNRCGLYFKNKKPNKTINQYFLKIIQLAINNDINIIFIKYPISKEYENEAKKLGINRKNYYENIFNNISYIFPNLKYKILDYHDRFFDKEYYLSDSDHLNNQGSEVLSQQINKDFNNHSDDLQEN